jgi:hypothetical protein
MSFAVLTSKIPRTSISFQDHRPDGSTAAGGVVLPPRSHSFAAGTTSPRRRVVHRAPSHHARRSQLTLINNCQCKSRRSLSRRGFQSLRILVTADSCTAAHRIFIRPPRRQAKSFAGTSTPIDCGTWRLISYFALDALREADDEIVSVRHLYLRQCFGRQCIILTDEAIERKNVSSQGVDLLVCERPRR